MSRFATRFFILLLFCVSVTNLFSKESPKMLAQISGDETDLIRDIQQLPATLHLRTDSYIMVTLPESALADVEKLGYTATIIDRQPGDVASYYWVTPAGRQSLNALPAGAQAVYHSDRDAIIKSDSDPRALYCKSKLNVTQLSADGLPWRQTKAAIGGQTAVTEINDQVITALVNRVSMGMLEAGLLRLQAFVTRWSGSDSVYAAGDWLVKTFREYGYDDVKFDTLRNRVEGKIQRNVIVTKRGKTQPDKIVMIGGHYDSIVHDGSDPFISAPGVDDDGTGTIATLEAARVLADIDLDKTVIFACWAAEEQGLYGSTDYVAKAVAQNLDIELYINFDMIGNLDESDPIRNFSVETNTASMAYAELMAEMAQRYTTLVPDIFGAGGGSDHVPFMQAGYSIVYGEEGDFSPNWHRQTDTIDNIDLEYFLETTRSGIATLAQVAGPPDQFNLPYLTFKSIQIDDDQEGQSNGNNNGFVDPGETLELSLQLQNVGNLNADASAVVIHSDNNNVDILSASASFPAIAALDSAAGSVPLVVHVSENAANNESFVFSMQISATDGQIWEAYFSIKVQQPEIDFVSYAIDELAGDGDDIPEAGETCKLSVYINNQGVRSAQGITASISTTDPDIEIVTAQGSFDDMAIGAHINNKENPFVFSISDQALPHAISFRVQLSEGEGYYQTEFNVSILLDQGPVLIVADDGQNDNRDVYLDLFYGLGVPLQLWHVASMGEVPLDMLLNYNDVFWYTGGDAKSVLSESDKANLSQYLDQGGHLFMTGDFIGMRLNNTAFLTDYLHASFVSVQIQLHNLIRAENPVTDIQNISLDRSGSNWPTEIDPVAPAVPIYKYNPNTSEGPGIITSSGTAAVACDNGISKVIFCSFQVEAILDAAKREELIMDVLDWFNGAPIDLRSEIEFDSFEVEDDSSVISVGDGDGYINPGETVALFPVLRNKGTLAAINVAATLSLQNEYITLMDSTSEISEIPTGQTVRSDEPFVVHVDENAPQMHEVTATITVTDSSDQTWTLATSVNITQSNTISGIVIDFETGEGIANATVLCYLEASELVAQADADMNGWFRMAVPEGTYAIVAEADGYVDSEAMIVTVPPDTSLRIVMTSPALSLDTDSLQIQLDGGAQANRTIMIANTGSGKLGYVIVPSPASLGKQSGAAKATILKPLKMNKNMFPAVTAPILNKSTDSAPASERWQLICEDSSEVVDGLDLNELYIQHTNTMLYFKQTSHHQWVNFSNYYLFLVFMDCDNDPTTGIKVSGIGAEYAVTLGARGNYVLRWDAQQTDFIPVGGNPVPSHSVLPQIGDSLEVGFARSSIGNPPNLKFISVAIDASGLILDAAPDQLPYIPYYFQDVPWLKLSRQYGLLHAGDSQTMDVLFDASQLTDGLYQTILTIFSNQPSAEWRTIPVTLQVGTSGITDMNGAIPSTFALQQNYPNPFSVAQFGVDGTMIRFQLPQPEFVTLKIYNVLGQEVASLVHQDLPAGYHQIRWNGISMTDVPTTTGLYIYKLQAGTFSQSKKMMIVR
ncbi:M20/M25/M40 family metallo-hydrolase [candidate division KSB1 bacterium]|nr:M20/M25/M40 family metallo-hydrolase [candidate division KSB1 bacterium]